MAAGCLVFVAGCDNGAAQNEQPTSQPITAMVETYSCQYKDGRGPDDLDEVVADWNAWMDSSEAGQYSAWTWTPFYFAPDEQSDFVWFGIAPNAETLESGHDHWLANGRQIQAQFDPVAHCDSHFNFAATNFRQSPDRAGSSGGVVTFTGCDIVEGQSFGDVSFALTTWAAHVTDMGSVRGMWVLRRAYGSGNDEADFRWVNTFPNHAALGADSDRFRTAGDSKARELFGHIFKCGVTRVYNATTRRIGIDDKKYRLD